MVRFVFKGNTVIRTQELEAVVASYLVREITFDDLRQVCKVITKLYLDKGYITSGAFLPIAENQGINPHGAVMAKQQAVITAQIQAKSALSLYQKVEKQTPNILSLTAQLNQLNFLLELDKWTNLTEGIFSDQKQLIQPLLQQLLSFNNQFDDFPAIDSIYARLNLAESFIQVAQNAKLNKLTSSQVENPLLTALSISHQALDTAEKLNNTRAKSYALGTIGKIYSCLEQPLESQKYLEPAMELAQSVKAWDIAYQWQWRLGRLYRQLKQTQKTDKAYASAINSLDQVRGNILAMNPDLQFDFKEKVEPVYHEYMEFLC